MLLIRRIAGAKRSLTALWTGKDIPEAYTPITGTLRERLRISVKDPSTLTDVRWMVCYYLYGALLALALPCGPSAWWSTACGPGRCAAARSSCR